MRARLPSEAMDAHEELSRLLRPAGGGVYVVSTGRQEQQAVQRRLYRASTDDEVQRRFEDALGRIPAARAVILGIPSDVGAGYVRGANLGPQAIRARLLDDDPDWPERAEARGIVDIGDVFVVPQLLHDSMLSEAQLDATRRAVHPGLDAAERARLPVSPLSVAERALELVFQLAPHATPFVIGGDHSCTWPVVSALSRARRSPFGIVQSDAHTDLLSERLGVRYCFATWSFHANDLLGRGGKLVQVGIRATRHDRGHWERTLGVRQFWADECRRDPAAALDAIVESVRASGAERVYFSNDIDGTDERFADATGTPEPEGLEPEFLVELIRRLGREVGLLGGDVMEVAPPLVRSPGGVERTLGVAARYVRETLEAMLGARTT